MRNNLMAGSIYIDPSFIKRDGLIVKTDRQGAIQWTKKIHAPGLTNTHLDNMCILFDNSYLFIGRQFEPEDRIEYPFVVKINSNGDLLWYKSYKLSFVISPDILIRPQQIAEDEAGNIYFSFNVEKSPGYSIITKLNANGDIAWSKGFMNDSRLGGWPVVLNGLFIQGNELLVTGVSQRGFIGMKLNISDGSSLSIKNYEVIRDPDFAYPDWNTLIKSFKLDNDTYILVAKCNANLSNQIYMFVQFDHNLDIIDQKRIDANTGVINSSGYRDILIRKTGEIIYSFPVDNTNKLYIGRTDSLWNITEEKKFLLNGSGYYNTTSHLSATDNTIRLTPGYAQSPLFGLDCYFLTQDNLLDQECLRNEDTTIANIIDFRLSTIPFTWERIDNNALTEQPFNVTIEDEPLIKQDICRTINKCDTLKINGPDSICLYNIDPIYSIIKSPNCLKNLNWKIDTSAISSITHVNDTAISLTFKKEWTGYLYASLDGCTLKDSIRITSFKNTAEDLLPSKDVLCIGQNDILSPGSGYNSYLWHDGSIEDQYLVNEPGKYWVTVIDHNGCKNSDTISVLNLVAPPSEFISIDTSICRHETLKLMPDISFSTYLWSNGSTASALEINQPGNYSLRVTDENGCIGEQSITIGEKSSCLNWIAFPSAFTPNNDGNNDDFKPQIRGNLVFYQLQIFNRWGQRIFQTNNPLKGWTGLFNTKLQTPDVFIWMSSYQFSGEPIKHQKGSITLVN